MSVFDVNAFGVCSGRIDFMLCSAIPSPSILSTPGRTSAKCRPKLGASIHRSRSAIRGVCYGSCIMLLCAEIQFTLWQSGNLLDTIRGEYSSFIPPLAECASATARTSLRRKSIQPVAI
jgi:hypothetical protein